MKKHYNDIFWNIFGVNHRVYDYKDIFHLNKDKQAKEKLFNNFINNPNELSNDKYFGILNQEDYDFIDFFEKLIFGRNEQVNFYCTNIVYISINYKVIKQYKFKNENEILINLFAFQIAYIIEEMKLNDIDVSIFEKSLKVNSINPFIDKIKENLKIKTSKDLAYKFSTEYDDIKDKYNKKGANLEDISATTFQKDLSNWKSNKDFPSFIKIFLINKFVYPKINENKIGLLFQLLIIRALLYIQKEFKITQDDKNYFLNKLSNFREFIKLNHSKKEILNEEQNKYLGINIINIIQNDNIIEIQNELKHKWNKFVRINNKDEPSIPISAIFPNKQKFFDEFNYCENIDDYKNLLNNIDNNILTNEIYTEHQKQVFTYLKFIISVKIEERIIFKQSFKELDRVSGGVFKLYNVPSDFEKFTKLLRNKNDFIECFSIVSEEIKKYQQ